MKNNNFFGRNILSPGTERILGRWEAIFTTQIQSSSISFHDAHFPTRIFKYNLGGEYDLKSSFLETHTRKSIRSVRFPVRGNVRVYISITTFLIANCTAGLSAFCRRLFAAVDTTAFTCSVAPLFV